MGVYISRTPVCIYWAWPQFVFTGPSIRSVFTGPGPKFVFTGPSLQFYYQSGVWVVAMVVVIVVVVISLE